MGVDRRITLTYVGGAAGVISFIFALALLANNNWVSWDAKERPHPVNEASSGSLGPFRSSGGSLHGVSSTFSNSRRAAQAFTLIGFFATLPLLVASIYGGWRQNAAHPWPKVAFLSIAVHWLCNFCALIAFGVVKHETDSIDFISASYSGGWVPLIILFFAQIGWGAFFVRKFGFAGVIGTGAIPEDATQFSGESMGGYQVSESET